MQDKNFSNLQFSHTIRSLRVRNGMSQVEFARLLGITPGAVCNWEKGLNRPADKRLAVIADKLGVSFELLLHGAAGGAVGNTCQAAATRDQTGADLPAEDCIKRKKQVRTLVKLLSEVTGIEFRIGGRTFVSGRR